MEKAATGIYAFKGLRERRFACVGKPVFKLGISLLVRDAHHRRREARLMKSQEWGRRHDYRNRHRGPQK